ncbi:RNA polymerase sigma factor [Cohnella terricola]|nr:RNA polymerase sigma factor [Cohnella terricola]
MGVIPAYEALVAPHLEDLRKYCMFLTRSKWDSEDLFQETLLKSLIFFMHTEPYVEVKAFLVRVARNLWIDDCRKKQRRRLAVFEQPRTYYADSDYVEVRGAIEWLAERFPRRNIEMWLLFNYFGYSMQEIAQATNCTVSAVKSILFRTREMLRHRHELPERRKIAHLDVERWSRAIIQDRPQGILSKG